MELSDRVSGEDLKAGRLLVQKSLAGLALAAEISHDTVQRLEAGLKVRPDTVGRVVATLEALGVQFIEPGRVHHVDGRMAPTAAAVGTMHGDRIRKARWRLAWTKENLASQASTTVSAVKKVENAKSLTVGSSLDFYRLVGVLQLEGNVFGRSGRFDRCLAPRPILWLASRNRIKDLAPASVWHPRRSYLEDDDEFDDGSC